MKEKGQTLVEVLAGLGMILIVVTALIGMGIVALKASTSARNRTVAAKLANEGMELVRSERDQHSWEVFKASSPWNYSTGIFTRSAIATEEGGSDKVKVVVTVSWEESSGTKTTSVTSYLTDWR